MSDKQVVVQSGMSPCFVLFVVFLVLKLCGTITWSWWWVTAPLWIPFGIVVGIFLVIAAIAGLIALFGVLCVGFAAFFKAFGRFYRRSQR